MKPGIDYIGVGCGALIFNDQGQMLLMQRAKGAANEPGFWAKPGGAIEFEETAEQAIKREIKEELNIDIEIIGWLPHVDHKTAEGQHWVAINFVAKVVGGELTNMEPHKCDAVEWFDFDALPEKLNQVTTEPIEQYKKGNVIMRAV